MSKLVGDALWVALSQALLLFLRILLLPYLVRALSQEEFGTYGQVLLVVDLSVALLLLGIARGVYVVYASRPADREAIFRVAFTGLLGVGVAAYGALLATQGLVAQAFNNPTLLSYLPIYGIVLVLQVPSTALSSTLLYFGKARSVVWSTVLQTILTLAALFWAVQSRQLSFAFWGMVLAAAVAFLRQWWGLRGTVRMGLGWNIPLAADLWRASWGTAAATILATISLRSGEILTSLVLTLEEYALYRAGAFELPFFSNLYASISMVLTPHITQLYYAKDFATLRELKRRAIRATVVFVYPVVALISVFGVRLIELYLGSNYAASGVVFAVFNAVLLFRITEYGDILVAARRQRLIFWANFLYALLSLSTVAVGANAGGIVGVAAAQVISIFFLAGILLFATARQIGYTVADLVDFWFLGRVFLVCFGLLIPLYLLAVFARNNMVLFGVIGMYGISVAWIGLWQRWYDPLLIRSAATRLPWTISLLGRWYPEIRRGSV